MSSGEGVKGSVERSRIKEVRQERITVERGELFVYSFDSFSSASSDLYIE